MKSAVYLDAHIFSCPPTDAGVAAFSEYVQNLISWTDLRRGDWIDVYISRNASQALAEANSYPPYPDLIRTISLLNFTHIQPRDVVELINGFLTKSRIIEDELEIDDLLFEDFNLDPTVSYHERRNPFPYHFELVSVLLSLHRQFSAEVSNQLLITSQDIQHIGETRADALVTELLTTASGIIRIDTEHPLPVSVQFFLCRCLHSFHLGADPVSIWVNAKGEFALRKALELFVYQGAPRKSPYSNLFSDNQFSFGAQFVESCKNLGFFHDIAKVRMLLRACSETIFNKNTRATHKIRVNEGGNSPHLTREEDTAWRRDIDHEYHLHYWATQNGPEFAAVVHHNDYSIPF